MKNQSAVTLFVRVAWLLLLACQGAWAAEAGSGSASFDAAYCGDSSASLSCRAVTGTGEVTNSQQVKAADVLSVLLKGVGFDTWKMSLENKRFLPSSAVRPIVKYHFSIAYDGARVNMFAADSDFGVSLKRSADYQDETPFTRIGIEIHW